MKVDGNNVNDAIINVNVKTLKAITKKDEIPNRETDTTSSQTSQNTTVSTDSTDSTDSTVTPLPEVPPYVLNVPSQAYVTDSPPSPGQVWQIPQPSNSVSSNSVSSNSVSSGYNPPPSNSQSSSSFSGYYVPTSSSGYNPQNTPPSDNNVNSENIIKPNILEVAKPVEETKSESETGSISENGENKIESAANSSNTNSNSSSEVKKISI